MSAAAGRRIVICGGGAIGVAVAWFLASRDARPVVVERHAVGGAASGKSGGFLALDWCRGTALDALARRSFALHAELAESLGNPWGYRRLDTFGGWLGEDGGPARAGGRPWLSPRVALSGRLGTPRTTALVEPHAFTTGLMQAAIERGAALRRGTVVGLARGRDGAVAGAVLADGETVAGDAVVVALGPWSILASRWLPLPAVYGLKGHSLVLDTGGAVPAEALFLEAREPSGEVLSPEIMPRADGTTWVCAISSTAPLPVDPAAVAPDRDAPERLEALCRAIAPALAEAPVVARQACFRPVTEDGLPLVGSIPGIPGAYVATGHSVWGMLNAPATGEAMAELILGGASRRLDLAPFAPQRMAPFDPARLAEAAGGDEER